MQAFRRQFFELGDERAVLIEELFRLVAAHPGFELGEIFRIRLRVENWDLVGAPEAFHLVAVHFFRAGPAFGRAQDDHGPAGALHGGGRTGFTMLLLDGTDLGNAVLGDGGHALMHKLGLVAFDEVRLPAHAAEEHLEFLMRDAGEDGGVGDLVAVEVQDGKHGAVADGIQELVRVPRGGERAGLGFAIADNHSDDQAWIVKGRAEAMDEGVAEFAALVDGARGLRGAVAADAAGEGELLEEALQAGEVLGFVRVDLGVNAFEIAVRKSGGRAVAGTGDIDHVEVVLLDQPVEVDPGEGLAGVGAPVAEQAVLDVLRLQRLAEKGIGNQVKHAGAEVIAGAPVGVGQAKFVRAERSGIKVFVRRGRGHRDLRAKLVG